MPVTALNMQQQPELLDQRKQYLEDFYALLSASRVEKFAFARAAKDDKDKLRAELRVWVGLWRDVLLTCAGSTNSIVNNDCSSVVQNLAAQIEFSQACRLLACMQQAINRIDSSYINVQLALEALLLEFPTLNLSNSPLIE